MTLFLEANPFRFPERPDYTLSKKLSTRYIIYPNIFAHYHLVSEPSSYMRGLAADRPLFICCRFYHTLGHYPGPSSIAT